MKFCTPDATQSKNPTRGSTLLACANNGSHPPGLSATIYEDITDIVEGDFVPPSPSTFDYFSEARNRVQSLFTDER